MSVNDQIISLFPGVPGVEAFYTQREAEHSTTWYITAIAPFARTLAAMAAGLIQFAVLFPLEKYVLFKKKDQP